MIFTLLIGACGSGGGSGDNPPPQSTEEEFWTGNQGFTLEDGEKADPLNNFRITAGDNNTLPSSVDYSSHMPEVRSQGTTLSCTSWAVGYYGKTFQEVMENDWDPDENAFSPFYLYAMQCRAYDNPWGIDKAWEILNRNGIAKWETLPFEDLSATRDSQAEKNNYADLAIPQQAHDEAKIFRCGEMARMRGLAQVKEALTRGPVVLAIIYYASPPRNPSPEENYMRYDPGNSNGHAILCVGYDDRKFGTGALKFVNSWGSGWGENGYSWIRYKDFSKIFFFAMNYKDIPNPSIPDKTDSRPAAPTDVRASDDAGSFVDITWSRVPGAQYYRIYRAEIEDLTTYAGIGIAYQSNYRDNPIPGVAYYYSVVAVNDLGESEHFPSDTDTDGHVDQGSAIGDVLTTPGLQWAFNDSDGSHFTVYDIDPAATAMEVLVSTASEGPWDSLGWIRPDDFTIKWGDESEYTNRRPFVRIRTANADSSSDLCDPVQVGEDIDNDVEVGRITAYRVTPRTNSILARWMTDGGNIDFFEIWRYCASNDTANDWVKIGYSDPQAKDDENYFYYEDFSPLPGVFYYYVVAPVYHGTYGQLGYSDNAFRIEDSGANLHLTGFKYYYTQISTPTAFPDIIVRNDGSTRIDSYSIGILAYDWNERKWYLVTEVTRDIPLEAGYQHTFTISNVDIPDDFANGHVYSWGLKIDYADQISETYEDDNLLWSNDGWWLATGAEASGDVRAAAAPYASRLGSTRPFSHNQTIVRGLSPMSAGDAPLTTYNGPSIFHRPDFCNDHRK